MNKKAHFIVWPFHIYGFALTLANEAQLWNAHLQVVGLRCVFCNSHGHYVYPVRSYFPWVWDCEMHQMVRWCFPDTCLYHMKWYIYLVYSLEFNTGDYVVVCEWYVLVCPPRWTASGELKWQGVICLSLFDSSEELIEINVWIDYKAHIIQPVEKRISMYFIIIIGV